MNIHKISIATVILFIICYTPTTIVNVFKNDGKGKCKHGKDDWDFQYSFMSIMNEIIYLGTLTNASFTFFIYFFIGKKFKKTLLSIFNIKKNYNEAIPKFDNATGKPPEEILMTPAAVHHGRS